MSGKQTAIITGASRGIVAGLVEGFLEKGYNVVAESTPRGWRRSRSALVTPAQFHVVPDK